MGKNYSLSEDGEKRGKEGKKIIKEIEGKKIENIVVVVKRWLGGIMIGRGGMMRDYGGKEER